MPRVISAGTGTGKDPPGTGPGRAPSASRAPSTSHRYRQRVHGRDRHSVGADRRDAGERHVLGIDLAVMTGILRASTTSTGQDRPNAYAQPVPVETGAG